MNKTGIMGGTFNPIHNGHLFLAENAYEQADLDKVLFMPSKNPPHKEIQKNITDKQRVEMIKIAIRENSHFELSELEFERKGYTYTADTLTLLTRENPELHYYFIVGTDSLFMMQDWMKPQVIFQHCSVLAAGRDNEPEDKIMKQIEYLKNTFRADINYIRMPMIQVSSEDIRKRIETGKTVRYYLPDPVIDYINKNKLYTAKQED